MRRLLNKRAQSTLEYAVLIAVVVGALVAMQIYMKRGVEGRMRSSTDNIGKQFDPDKTSYKYTTKTASETVETTSGGITTSYLGEGGKGTEEVTTRYGSETVEALD